MAGMFPTSFMGGVPGGPLIPFSYELRYTAAENQGIQFYGSNCVTFTQPQVNALLAEFASIFDMARWVYQPGMGANLWNALNILFGDGEPPQAMRGVMSINGYTGPNVTLTVSDIPGAAPLDSHRFVGTPSAPTQGILRDDTTIATTAFVQAVARTAMSGFSVPTATINRYGTVIVARPEDITAGTPGRAVMADQLQLAVSSGITAMATVDLQDAFGNHIGYAIP